MTVPRTRTSAHSTVLQAALPQPAEQPPLGVNATHVLSSPVQRLPEHPYSDRACTQKTRGKPSANRVAAGTLQRKAAHKSPKTLPSGKKRRPNNKRDACMRLSGKMPSKPSSALDKAPQQRRQRQARHLRVRAHASGVAVDEAVHRRAIQREAMS